MVSNTHPLTLRRCRGLDIGIGDDRGSPWPDTEVLLNRYTLIEAWRST